ncbi:hypothetical protein [Klebsiella spallanzanii]|uniref:Uncharacterized protein n=1 Tax=Klebsiella spallanzanii TaxID=2587528 RepID=A0A564J9W3_9ENTR|nr:hypothetical protein [Klebsiella spallanzanii]VUS53685.1 hypothetical protein SB6408_04532 [Klebsiella spallanzanii]
MNDCGGNIKTIEEQEKELIDKAELLFEHQKEQYESSVVRVRRLEDKALKTFGSLNLIITVALLIVRYWWVDIFPGKYTPLHAFCWVSLSAFIIMCFISWGFSFSAMQLKDWECPSSDPQRMEVFYMDNKIYNSLSAYAKEYSRLAGVVGNIHEDKTRLINNCFESMLFGAWAFTVFLISVVIIKV